MTMHAGIGDMAIRSISIISMVGTMMIAVTMALTAMISGASFGDVIQMLAEHMSLESAAVETGAMLGRWLHNGLICNLR